ncbi:Protein CBG04907 [Caenorhabditis briggsae]|uniref:Protein CBG04907 n=1 Tax=Caenorhabditis briggsae TaxID=6238 RepID=A8WYS2_CAEBR|nr:Protein CBG04907 [Caenorhabditis briggsae]CAP25530.1 Protein CBG04907 [Caenorhabditis briggsae]
MNNFPFFGIPDLLKWKILVFLALPAVFIFLFAIICLVIQKCKKYRGLVGVSGEISDLDETETEVLVIDGHFLEFFETRENSDLTRNAIVKQDDEQVAAILEKTKTTLIQQEILGSIGSHPNVSSFLNFANVIDSPVWEYIEGRPLRSFLKKHKNQFSNQIVYSEIDSNGYMLPNNKMQKTDELEKLGVFKPILCTLDLISFAYQIANGMKYLAGRMIVHQNLALHNIYMTANKTIRLRGFDFARARNYRMSSVVPPLLWTAPETFRDNVSNEKSDVWSFAICLFELWTLGDLPEEMDPAFMFSNFQGKFPEPEFCPPRIYKIMENCWNITPSSRPNFSDYKNVFSEILDSFDPEILKNLTHMMKEELKTRTNISNAFVERIIRNY